MLYRGLILTSSQIFLIAVLWLLSMEHVYALAPNFTFEIGGATFGGARPDLSTLYSDVACPQPDLENLFSGFVCVYQQIVDEIMTNLYYAMLEYFAPPFIAALTLFLITVGVTFAMGILPFTTRDIMLVLTKIVLLTSFALNPELMIDIVYRGFIGFMRQTTDAAVSGLLTGHPNITPSVAGIFSWMDDQLFEFIDMQDNARQAGNCENDVLALLFGLAVTMPPVFLIALYLLFQLIMVFIRTTLGYLLAITGIMFLTTMAPLFFGFGLFKFTVGYFDKWLKYLLSFAVQIFVVFSFIAVVLNFDFSEKLDGVLDTIKPYNETAYHEGQRMNFDNWCTLCMNRNEANLGDLRQASECNAGDDESVNPALVGVGGIQELIQFIGKEIFALAVLAYLVETILKAAPEVAKHLGSLPTAPSIASGKLPGFDQIGGSISAAGARSGSVPQRFSGGGDAARRAQDQLVNKR